MNLVSLFGRGRAEASDSLYVKEVVIYIICCGFSCFDLFFAARGPLLRHAASAELSSLEKRLLDS